MREAGETLPKPLVEVGGRPILWHVMCLYASQGMQRFVLLLGHGAEQIRAFAAGLPAEWEVTCLDTGLDTPTGGRVLRAEGHLDHSAFCLTYADGLADLDLGELLEFHASHPGAATMTLVRPPSPWGVAEMDRYGRVRRFREKPQLESWINGGFMVLGRRAVEAIGPDDDLERDPLERLAASGQLYGYRHEGFWDCMDTYKDTLLLNELWERGEAPWAVGVRT
jgi:glucose-1-phosphate cytidylyltransferase